MDIDFWQIERAMGRSFIIPLFPPVGVI